MTTLNTTNTDTIDNLTLDIVDAICAANHCADIDDSDYNRINFDDAIQSAESLSQMGQHVRIEFEEGESVRRIVRLIINGERIRF